MAPPSQSRFPRTFPLRVLLATCQMAAADGAAACSLEKGPAPRAETGPGHHLGVLYDMHGRSDLHHLRDLHSPHPLSVSARRGRPGGASMLRKNRVSAIYLAIGNTLTRGDPMLGPC